MEKKRNQSNHNSLKEPSNKISSTLRHLLFCHKLPRDFPLEQQIKEFNVFWKKARVACLDLDGRLEAFAQEKKWTDDERKNFRIMSAIKDGWSLVFDRTAKEHLIAQKDGQGADWVYKYQCRKCKSVDQRGITRMLSEYQYNQLPEDEARKALLETEINSSLSTTDGWVKCPNCGEYAQFKKVKARTQSWEMEKFLRKTERTVERKSIKGIPLTHEQVRDLDKALHEIQENVIKKGNELIYNRIPTKKEIKDFRIGAKPYMKRFYEVLGGRLCARRDCLEILPQGSRTSRQYCSENCKTIDKSRRARMKATKKARKKNNKG